MRSRLARYAITIFLIPGCVPLIGCGPAVSSPGAHTVASRCRGCHEALRAGQIAPTRWHDVRIVHRGRVQLSDDEWLAVERFLTQAP